MSISESGIDNPFDRTFAAGSRHHQKYKFDLGGTIAELACFCVDGSEPGPSLLVTAGVHGAEYPGIQALVDLGTHIDPNTFRGRLILLPVANSAAFRARTAFVTPPDGKNLNRCFPGNPDGSYTEQLAHVLLDLFMSRADAYIDLHSGDLVEALHPFSSYAVTGNESVDLVARDMARAFGFETVIRFSADDRGSLSHVAAALRGVPSLLAEIGGQGVWSGKEVNAFVSGIRSVMTSLGMRSEDSPTSQENTFYNRFDWYFANVDGLWYPSTEVGVDVQPGETLGEVRSVFGEVLQTVTAEDSGLNVFMLTALSARSEDPLIGIAADATK